MTLPLAMLSANDVLRVMVTVGHSTV